MSMIEIDQPVRAIGEFSSISSASSEPTAIDTIVNGLDDENRPEHVPNSQIWWKIPNGTESFEGVLIQNDG